MYHQYLTSSNPAVAPSMSVGAEPEIHWVSTDGRARLGMECAGMWQSSESLKNILTASCCFCLMWYCVGCCRRVFTWSE